VKTPQLKSPRLLPIVIFAALALLLFKGIGLVTGGGYVLTGTQVARASETEASAAAPSVENAAPRTEPTMSDTSPTLTDVAPTVAGKPGDAAAHGEGAATAAATTPASTASADTATTATAPVIDHAAVAKSIPAIDCAATPAATPSTAAATAPTSGTTDVSAATLSTTGCAPPADAVPVRADANGNKTPLTGADGKSLTQDVVLQRLSERRAELDKQAAALNMREAIVEAAEKQMQERADALKALEAQIAALSDQKKAAEDGQFVAIVNMYETMKPQEAAAIFNGLDMAVLARVAKAMSPRKMAPILAKMTSARAQELTTRLAAADTQVATAVPAADPNALPQIVGH
jgi:flagellar motility protein MotE (MotC chaperone)